MENNFLKNCSVSEVKYIKISAFSLIELSIVLIIIGLLVAGITGGKSLIDSARNRAFIKEIKDYEQAVWTFKAAKDRYPGDIKNFGTFGTESNYQSFDTYPKPFYQYVNTDFPPPYNTMLINHSMISFAAPFIELNAENIIDFKPPINQYGIDFYFPNSKFFKKSNIYYVHTGSNLVYKGEPIKSEAYKGIANQGIQQVLLYQIENIMDETQLFDSKIFKFVDEKIDDGIYWNGRVRARSMGGSDNDNTYDDFINNNIKCETLYYTL